MSSRRVPHCSASVGGLSLVDLQRAGVVVARGVVNDSHLLRIRAASAVALVGLIAVSLSTPSAAATTARPGRAKPGIAWTRCTEPPAARSKQFQCAKVPVPLDWAKPNGMKIELAVIRHLASRPQQRIGSMFVNPGGPGQSGYELVANSGQDFDEWGGGRFDVVSWDPRGTNRSSPVQCCTSQTAEDRFWAGVSIPTTPAASAAYQRKTVELARRCGAVSGERLSHITTADNARDLDTLRKLVGDRTLTYVGLSWGSLLGQTYANLSRTGCGRCCSTASSTRWTTPAAPRRGPKIWSRLLTRSSRSSSPCANAPAPAAARSPVTARPSPNG